ncbi:hypothetical protein HK107_09545 [Parvularcula sp. ZS-1/3]|uniref:Uncharacterized protein n=1 Tax=Parvularcula mediterranea TaxID=2732508 RepID=A0A7Y3RM14_9PROT|nr:hypothetical protein [Parvularcula mediterranea]NNU16563.1 hypothetical protein [Parvularcula mediterranea]
MSFSGTYAVEINTPMGKQEGTLTLVEDGGALTGTMAAQGDTAEIKNGSVNGDTAMWDVDVSKPMPLTLGFEGKKDGGNINGSVKLGAFGNSTFTATAQ